MIGYQNPYLNMFGVPSAQMPAYQQPAKQVEKVNGQNGALQYPLGPNSSAWILDESGKISWLVITDSAGYKTVTPYDVTPHRDEQAVQYDSLESRITRLEEMMNAHTADTSAAEQKQPVADARTGKADDEHGPVSTEPAARIEPARHEQSATEAGNGYRQSVWR